ncbi:hypothetical protein A8B77_01475 [Erythrobacter sp. EhN03]|nr:hypothetical protein A8B77_01475 [Erythrobacter sp. EhN03]
MVYSFNLLSHPDDGHPTRHRTVDANIDAAAASPGCGANSRRRANSNIVRAVKSEHRRSTSALGRGRALYHE